MVSCVFPVWPCFALLGVSGPLVFGVTPSFVGTFLPTVGGVIAATVFPLCSLPIPIDDSMRVTACARSCYIRVDRESG